MGRSGLCTICGVNFKNLDKHMKCVHDKTDEEIYCEFCCKIFRNNKSKFNHVLKVKKIGLKYTCCPNFAN